MSRKTFKEISTEVPNPKILTLDEELPYVFDLHWDAKTLRYLYLFEGDLSPEILRELRQAGYDTNCLPINPHKE